MQRGPDTPRTQSVEEDRVLAARFVGVILVPEFLPIMHRINEFGQLTTESLHLRIIEHTYASDIAIGFVERQLFLGESMLLAILGRGGLWKQIAHGRVLFGEIDGHRCHQPRPESWRDGTCRLVYHWRAAVAREFHNE